jgi:hypothetical protein
LGDGAVVAGAEFADAARRALSASRPMAGVAYVPRCR